MRSSLKNLYAARTAGFPTDPYEIITNISMMRRNEHNIESAWVRLNSHSGVLTRKTARGRLFRLVDSYVVSVFNTREVVR